MKSEPRESYLPGERVVRIGLNEGSHEIILSSERDDDGYEWLTTISTESEFVCLPVVDYAPYDAKVHGPWVGFPIMTQEASWRLFDVALNWQHFMKDNYSEADISWWAKTNEAIEAGKNYGQIVLPLREGSVSQAATLKLVLAVEKILDSCRPSDGFEDARKALLAIEAEIGSEGHKK